MIAAGLNNAQRFLASTQQTAALQNMVNQQNALRNAAAQAAGAPLGGAPLILSHHGRLQIPTTVSAAGTLTPNAAQVTAAGLINGSLGIHYVHIRAYLIV